MPFPCFSPTWIHDGRYWQSSYRRGYGFTVWVNFEPIVGLEVEVIILIFVVLLSVRLKISSHGIFWRCETLAIVDAS